MSFTLSGGSPTVEVSASAWISSQTDTTATITVQSNSWMVYSGSWVQSSGVVANAYVGSSAWLGAKTIFGNGNKTSGTSVHSVTHSYTVNKSTSSQSVYWESRFYSYIDGTNLGHKATKSGYVTVGAKTSYTVNYNANGGTNAPAAQTKWHGTNLTLSSTVPTRTGYSFQGWGTSASDTSVDYAKGATYSSNSGVTLYAIWKADTYAISYDANEGSGAPGNQTKTYGVDLTLSTVVPTRTNHNFLGWSTSPTAVTAEYAPGATFTTNAPTTLYAVWELAYIPPTIVGLSVHRCASDFTLDDYGTCALVTFDWETCQLIGENEVASIDISIDGGTPTTITPGGISGTVRELVGSENLSVDTQYTITVTVTDSMDGSTPRSIVLPGASFPLDFKAGGTGAAFGRPAELDALDVNWDAIFRKGVIIGDPDGEFVEILPDSSGGLGTAALVDTLGTAHILESSVVPGANYTDVDLGDTYLIGNNLRVNFYATRSSSVAAGNITNETVCTITVKHGGRIKDSFNVSFTSGSTGGNASFTTANLVTTEETLTFDVILAAIAQATTSMNSYFIMPVSLNMDALPGGGSGGDSGGDSGGGGTYATADVSDFVPGKIFAYAGVNDPIGSLPCDGREVSRREYWELFQAVGTTYGAGDGTTTFNLPNLESRVVVGEGGKYSLGATGGEEKHTLTIEEMPSHYHSVGTTASSSANLFDAWSAVGSSHIQEEARYYGANTTLKGGDQPHNNMQPYIVLRYFITTGKGEAVNGVNPADYVVEWGETDGWHWEKWASGKAECWAVLFEENNEPYTTWNNMPFRYTPTWEFPIEFTDVPSVSYAGYIGSGFAIDARAEATKDWVRLFFATSATGSQRVEAHIQAKGYWKDAPESGGIQISDVSDYIAGRIFAYAGSDDPPSGLLCDGREVSRREYWELFQAIGVTYGAGDGSSTFNLPNIESRTIIGESDSYALGATGGEEKHAQTVEELATHTHSSSTYAYRSGSQYGWLSTPTGNATAYGAIDVNYTGGGQPFNIMQPYIVMRYFITTGKGDPVSGINPADYVVDWGSTDIWSWRKYASGYAECWGAKTVNTGGFSAWGGMYISWTGSGAVSLPFEFAEVPTFECSATSDTTSSLGVVVYGGSTMKTPAVEAFRSNNPGPIDIKYQFMVKGKWKDSPASGGTATIAPTVKESVPLLRDKQSLPQNGDLNTIVTPGTYACNDVVAASLSNSPSTIGFSMTVEHSYDSDDYITQTVRVPSLEIEYRRRYNPNVSPATWSTWKSDFSEDTDWTTLNSYVKYRRVGKIVFVKGESSGDKTLTKGDYTTVGTLPTGFRPASGNSHPFMYDCIGGSIGTPTAYVDYDGDIMLYQNDSTGKSYWRFSVSFPTDTSA